MSEETNAFWSQVSQANRYATTGIFVLLGTARTTMKFIQFLMRLHEEKLMSEGKLKSLEQLIQLTGGEIETVTIPLYEGMNQEEQVENIDRALKELGIGHVNLPDANSIAKALGKEADIKGNILYYSVPKNQMPKMGIFMKHYTEDAMSGKKLSVEEIKAFTDGRVCAINLDERCLPQLENLLQAQGVSWGVLGDFDFDDKMKQILVPMDKIRTVEMAYQRLANHLMSQGEKVNLLSEISYQDYISKSRVSPEKYMDTMKENPEVANAIKKYENKQPAVEEQKVIENTRKIRSVNDPSCQAMMEDNHYYSFAVQKDRLVDHPQDQILPVMQEQMPDDFLIRIPGTYGMKDESNHLSEQMLVVPREQVFLDTSAQSERYVVHLDKSRKPEVLQANGTYTDRYQDAKEVYEKYAAMSQRENTRPLTSAKDLIKEEQENLDSELLGRINIVSNDIPNSIPLK